MYAAITYDDGTVTSVVSFSFINVAHKYAALEMAAELLTRGQAAARYVDEVRSILSLWDNGGDADDWREGYEAMREFAVGELLPETIVTALYDQDAGFDAMIGSVDEIKERIERLTQPVVT